MKSRSLTEDHFFCPAASQRCIWRVFRCTEPMVSDNQASSSAVGATSCKTVRCFDRVVFRKLLDGVDLVRAVANIDEDTDFFR